MPDIDTVLPELCAQRAWVYEPDPDPTDHGIGRALGLGDIVDQGSLVGAVLARSLDVMRQGAGMRGRHLVRIPGEGWTLEMLDVSWMHTTRHGSGHRGRRRVHKRFATVTLPGPIPPFGLERTPPLNGLLIRFGVGGTTDDTEFDRRFWFRANDGRARALLTREVRRALLATPFQTLAVSERDPRVLVASDEGRWYVEDHDRVREAVARLVAALGEALGSRSQPPATEDRAQGPPDPTA